MKCKNKLLSLALLGASLTLQAQNEAFEMTLQTNKTGAAIPSTMYGIFFEDINFGADGGLYAELVKNRSFEFPQTLMGWDTFGKVSVRDDGPFKRNPHYVRLAPSGHRERHTGLENEGFFGIGLHKDADYRFSVWARNTIEGEQKLLIQLTDDYNSLESQVITQKELTVNSTEWKQYEVIIRSPRTIAKAHLRLTFKGTKGEMDLEHVSLFPVDTWKGHKNGMRKDLAQALADLKPGVFRFPGGCIVEGADLATRYNWKNTIGPVEDRPLNENRWNCCFPNRLYPDYFQSYGLGFYEFFLLSEEIGAAPLPIVNVGMACQFQNWGNNKVHAPLDQLDSYIQDAIDLVEFANGDTTTHYGKIRAQMGHPKPFGLKYMGIGNEQWGQEYVDRLAVFVKAMRKAHPEIEIVGSSGPNSEGKDFDFLWPEMKKLKVDLVDEHFYRPESWFLAQGKRYDNYDRKGPKVFAGEYACHGKGRKWNHFHAALLEAGFMTGLERNADIVQMATYAPLFAHVEGWQWRPDLIWFDNLNPVRTCSYYVQQLYGLNKGTNVLPLTHNGASVSGDNGIFASAVWDAPTQTYIVKIVNTTDKALPVDLQLKGLKKKVQLTEGEQTLFTAADIYKDNTIEQPNAIVPVTSPLKVSGQSLQGTVGAYSFVMYKLKAGK